MAMHSPVNMSFADAALRARSLDASSVVLDGVAPPGWEPSIKKMKKSGDVSNPFALAWWMKHRGMKPAKHENEADAEFEASLDFAIRETGQMGFPVDCLAAARGELWAQAQLMGDGHQFVYQERPWR